MLQLLNEDVSKVPVAGAMGYYRQPYDVVRVTPALQVGVLQHWSEICKNMMQRGANAVYRDQVCLFPSP
jgi:hypothetical protein